jgi:predicted methyltransferase
MGGDIYKVLIASLGYFIIESNSKGNLLIYRTEHNIENIDVDNLNLADYNDFEITLEIVDDYKTHSKTEGKKGSHKEKISVSTLSSFNKFSPS